MNKFAFILSILLTSSVFAGDCGPNCYQGDINGDGKADELKFVIGGASTLKLKITRTGTKTVIKAHDKIQEPTVNVEYKTISTTAVVTKGLSDEDTFRMTVLEGQRTVNLQWKEEAGHFGLAKFQILSDGRLTPYSDNGE